MTFLIMFKHILNKPKKRSTYRIIKSCGEKLEPVWHVEYRKYGLFWERYYWKVPLPEDSSSGHNPDYYVSICTSEEMAKQKLKECKALRTTEVIYEE